MAMNFAPLDCSCQGASSEPKKICGGREKLGKSKMLIFQGNDSKFHIIPKTL
jgi:hypothetical protein